MSAQAPIADYEVTSGALRGSRFTLYADRLVHQGDDAMETVPLAHLASVRVAFERDPRKLNLAIALLVAALLLALASGPLQGLMADLSAKVGVNALRESLEAVLLACFTAIGSLARLMAPVAVVLAAGGFLMLGVFWVGRTTLTLAFAATERACAVRGRNRELMTFAELVGERLAGRRD